MLIERQRFIDIDCAKGLAIILVVIGHIVAREGGAPLGNEWYYLYLKRAIYTFHMPLFMFLSGWVFYYTAPISNSLKELKTFIFKKAYRLLVPFFAMAFVIILGKYFAGKILFVDNPVNNIATSIINLFWHTKYSCASFIWYVYVVFIFIVFTVLWMKIFKSKWNLIPLLLISLIINIVQLPAYLYLDFIGRNYIYFILGCIAFQHKDIYYQFINKYSYNFLLIALSCLTMYLIGIYFDYNAYWLNLPIAISIIPGIHGIIKTKTNENGILFKISKYTFPIYLFNVPLIGLTKAIMLKFTTWNGIHFLIFLPILFVAGLYGAILLRKLFLEKIPVINKLTI